MNQLLLTTSVLVVDGQNNVKTFVVKDHRIPTVVFPHEFGEGGYGSAHERFAGYDSRLLVHLSSILKIYLQY